MGYIERNLMVGEKVVYEAKLHDIVYTGPCLIALFAFGAFFLPIDPIANVCIALIIGGFAAAWAISIHGGKQYVVTTHRLIFKEGYINRTSDELLLPKCEGVQIRQSLLGRLLDYGSVYVTTGEATNRYNYIKSPLKFSTCIHQQIFNLKQH